MQNWGTLHQEKQYETQEVKGTLLSGTCFFCSIWNPEGWRAIFISLWVITFRHEDQNWKLFSANFEQLLVDKCMNSGITGKKNLVWELQSDSRLKTEGNGVLFP